MTSPPSQSAPIPISHRAGPKTELDRTAKEALRAMMTEAASSRDRFRRWHRYYHRELLRLLKLNVPENQRVLEVGCSDGYLLEALKPSYGLGIDLCPAFIEAARTRTADTPALHFEVADAEAVTYTEPFDFVVMSDLLGNLLDIQEALENLRSACHTGTRVVANWHSILWEPLLSLGARLGLKMPQRNQNWLSPADARHFLELAGFEVITHQQRVLLPVYIPLLSTFLNKYLVKLPGLSLMALTHLVVMRKIERPRKQALAVSIVVPCRNEKGNIEPAIQRIPDFGSQQEILFVDGHSTDGTLEECQRVKQAYPAKDIKVMVQPGKGKGDAVRMGFAEARHPVLMILDSDLTTPPEDLPKFYDVLARGAGEFVNGSRLVYPMEKEAMRWLNLAGNKFFSLALSRFLGQSLKDTLCGTKVIQKKHYEELAARRAEWGVIDPFGDFDLLFGACRLHLKIAEVPVRYRDRTYGTTNIRRFRDGWLLFRMTWAAFRRFL